MIISRALGQVGDRHIGLRTFVFHRDRISQRYRGDRYMYDHGYKQGRT
jgi:hypothetical protein